MDSRTEAIAICIALSVIGVAGIIFHGALADYCIRRSRATFPRLFNAIPALAWRPAYAIPFFICSLALAVVGGLLAHEFITMCRETIGRPCR